MLFGWLRTLFAGDSPELTEGPSVTTSEHLPPGDLLARGLPESDLAEQPEVIEVPITDTIDLHPFPPREIRDVAISFLEAAHEEGLRELRLIHGRGTGTQRRLVRGALEQHPLVASFADDPGNWGATRVRLINEVTADSPPDAVARSKERTADDSETP